VRKLANGGAVTRGHFARFLVEAGKATTMADVFKNIWRAGKPDTFRHSGVQ
jgi:predicted metal-dependent phosphoesterase TrpH